jgi:hypothetical protein
MAKPELPTLPKPRRIFFLAESDRVALGGEDATALCKAPSFLAGPSPHAMPVQISPHQSHLSPSL